MSLVSYTTFSVSKHILLLLSVSASREKVVVTFSVLSGLEKFSFKRYGLLLPLRLYWL